MPAATPVNESELKVAPFASRLISVKLRLRAISDDLRKLHKVARNKQDKQNLEEVIEALGDGDSTSCLTDLINWHMAEDPELCGPLPPFSTETSSKADGTRSSASVVNMGKWEPRTAREAVTDLLEIAADLDRRFGIVFESDSGLPLPPGLDEVPIAKFHEQRRELELTLSECLRSIIGNELIARESQAATA